MVFHMIVRSVLRSCRVACSCQPFHTSRRHRRGRFGTGMAEGPFWFTVKFGDNQTALFNADCWAIVLHDYIKESCGYADLFEDIELQREDGTYIGLKGMEKTTATEALKPKEVCILCKVVAPEEEGGPPTYEVLWTPPEGEEVPAAAVPAGKKK